MVAEFPDREIGPPRTEATSPTLPTRGMEIIRTPGLTRDQECAEKRAYTENIITLEDCYKIEDGLDNFMNLLLLGIMTASIM